MSARIFKIFIGVLLAHLVVLNVVWMGFLTPSPRPGATFIYEGALPAQDADNGPGDAWQKAKTSEQFIFDQPEGSNSDHWTGLRDPDVRTEHHDHLGF